MKTETLNFTVEQHENLPKKVAEKLQNSRNETCHVLTVQDRTYFIVKVGERKTGGYTVEVERVVQRGDVIHVYARETPPVEGVMVIQVLSYPLTVVSVKGKYSEDVVSFHVTTAVE